MDLGQIISGLVLLTLAAMADLVRAEDLNIGSVDPSSGLYQLVVFDQLPAKNPVLMTAQIDVLPVSDIRSARTVMDRPGVSVQPHKNAAVPSPTATWLFGLGLLGIAGLVSKYQ